MPDNHPLFKKDFNKQDMLMGLRSQQCLLMNVSTKFNTYWISGSLNERPNVSVGAPPPHTSSEGKTGLNQHDLLFQIHNTARHSIQFKSGVVWCQHLFRMAGRAVSSGSQAKKTWNSRYPAVAEPEAQAARGQYVAAEGELAAA